MAAINQASSIIIRSNTLFGSSSSHRDVATTAIHLPRRINTNNLQGMFAPNIGLVEEISTRIISSSPNKTTNSKSPKVVNYSPDHEVIMEKLYLILEAVSDRVEMHKNIGEQRANWNSLLLTSINTITLSAATMAAITTTTTLPAGAPLEALKLSSTFLYLAATGMLVIMNKIQPSQLAEEQRNAARLFKQLETEIKTKIAAIGGRNPTITDVDEAMKKVLAIDRAYPLPLIGVMLEKFPAKVEPAVWWPDEQQPRTININGRRRQKDNNGNGWSNELEEEMREIIRVLEIKDKDDYLRLGKKAVKLNKVLAIAGPLLTGLGAIGSACISNVSPPDHMIMSSWAMMLGVMGGAMASVVNTVQHGGQVGMVFEMYRSNAGFFEMIKESIESNLKEKDLESRENGQVFEMKVALRLGRSLSELRHVAASYARKGADDIEEFGSKLF
uniref:probable F-box protein At4g22030 n=1 Tax=Erigeron canadensis TaxID=72917 RepID=UPI001CB9D1EE|nr:probable F-box protein At4g22030 [Erigeron canadensis]